MKRKKSLTNNIKKGKITSVLGVIICIASIVSVFYIPGITWWPEGFVGITLGVILLYSPDTIIQIFKKFVGLASSNVQANIGQSNRADTTDINNLPEDQLIDP